MELGIKISTGAVSTEVDEPDSLAERTVRKVRRRLIPFMIAMFCLNFLDRVNISFAALQMNSDLHLTAKAYGMAAGILFVAYTALEIPSNLILHRVGARRWLARIMITWGLIGAAHAFIWNRESLYVARLLLGAAEAGFFPGIMLYLVRWFPKRERAAAITLFMIGNPIAIIVGAPLSTTLLSFGNMLGLAAWRWLFLLEGLPAVLVGIAALWWLTEKPEDAEWLEPEEREWLTESLHNEPVPARKSPASALATLKDGPTVALALSKMCVLLAFYGIALWLPQIVRSIGHLSIFATGFVSAIPYVCAAVGSILVGRHSDRTGERPKHISYPAFVGAFGFVLAAFAPSPGLALLGLSIGATGIWCSNAIFWTMPAAILSGVSAATGFALINSVGNLGGFFGPYLTGWVQASTGKFSLTLVALGIFLALSGVIVLLVARSIPQVIERRKAVQ